MIKSLPLIVAAFTATLGFAKVVKAIEPQPGDKIRNSLNMRLVYIPPGKFTMGSPDSEQGRESQETRHEVELTKGFYLGMHEVTVGQFRHFVRDANYQTDGQRDGKGGWGVIEAGSIEMVVEHQVPRVGLEPTTRWLRLLDEVTARFDFLANQHAEAEIRDKKFVDSGQEVCGK